MNSREILQALQAGTLSLEEAKRKLTRTGRVTERTQEDFDNANVTKVTPIFPDPVIEESGKNRSSNEVVAIIGISGRYPDACNLGQYWDNLVKGRNSIREIPESRWDVHRYYDPRPGQAGKLSCKWLGLLEDIEYFDPLFFNLAPAEAELIDPQQRIFLEEGYKAFEDAGYRGQDLSRKKCGVYLGMMSNEYSLILCQNRIVTNATCNSYAIAAARLPYFLNLKGPALSIDTACSSSLVATHLACQALLNREIELALVGGVTLYLTPEWYLGMSATGMLSPDGQCKTFDKSANGFVPGEGVGALVLKRLKDAESNRDHIYGLIIGSGVNQDGKTNGITAPSVNSQIELEREIYEQYRIDPQSIGYVEMHGTGTKLGDPIELEALATVFKEKTKQKNYCAIGSVKSNIGHTSAAAGMASVQKVLLSIKHHQLPPTLNFREPNEHFNFEDSPFYVNTSLQPWEVTPGTPRRAAVSSFGFSGTNAHLVIEEYLPGIDPASPIIVNSGAPVLVVLSAKSEQQLKIYAEHLQSFVESDEALSLANLAYTLQVGREAMEYRWTCLADSREALLEALKQLLDPNPAGGIMVVQVKKNNSGGGSLDPDQEAAVLLENALRKRNLPKIAALWLQGLDPDWERLYDRIKPRRISLPAYPFARERCWAPVRETKPDGRTEISNGVPYIHPLLHRNTSDLFKQRFSSTFTGSEFYLTDHLVCGQRVLPGVVYLEMARAAVEAAGALEEGEYGIRFQNIVWVRPLIVGDQPVQVHIGLFPATDRVINYEIYYEPAGAEEEPVILGQGQAASCPVPEVPALDLLALQAECGQNFLTPRQCYEAFQAMGIEYGPAFRGIEEIHVGPDQLLAKLSLPPVVWATGEQFVLHPSLLDAALQATIGFLLNSGKAFEPWGQALLKPSLPFILQEMDVFGKCDSTMWAVIRSGESGPAGEKIRKYDLAISDDTGRICLRMKGFSTKVPEEEVPTSPSLPEPLVGTVMLTPVWDAVLIEWASVYPERTGQVLIVGGTKNHVQLIRQQYPKARVLKFRRPETTGEFVKKLETHGLIDHLVWIAPDYSWKSIADQALITAQNQGVLQVFRMIKALLQTGYGTRDFGWTIITTRTQPIRKTDMVNPTNASIHGLIGSMAKEYPNWKIRLLDLEAGDDWPVDDLFTLPPDPQGNPLVYRDRQWYKEKLIPVQHPKLEQTLYKPGGVYVVIGGAGGIGEAWSEYMIRAYQARIVWIGRREKDAAIQGKLDALATFGPPPLYITADATNPEALQQAYRTIKERYSQINGVVHAAIVLWDKCLANMEEEQFTAGLSAKVDVSVRTAQVFQKEALDFVLFFSSVQSFTKAPGQSNYASGCAFKDVFAHQLAREWAGAVKVINWGYWGNVGIVASKAYQDRMAQAGIGSIEPPEAMKALEVLMSGPLDQMVFLKTTKPLAMEGLEAEEIMVFYPPNLQSNILNLSSGLLKQKARIERLRFTGSPKLEEMDEFLLRLLWTQLRSTGLFLEKKSTPTDLKINLGLAEIYDRWFEESLRILAANHYLSYDGKLCIVNKQAPADREEAWKEWERQKGRWLTDPDWKAHLILVETTLRALPEILTGKVPATEIIFPNSSLELVEGIYQRNRVADYFNETLADTVVTYIEERLKQEPSAQIRLIEIGAGTGGTSAMVFRKIKPYQGSIQEYCYTDLSKAFLIRAEEEYGRANPYLTYRIFNVEAPVAGQDINAGGYDLVIAANVLHATGNIRQTLRNTKALLKKNGLLLLNELSDRSLFSHLTFGLLEGWWLFEDPALRIPGCPGLTPESWKDVLENEGFRAVFFPAQVAHDFGQQIIVAESDGVVRQKQPSKPGITPVKKQANTIVSRDQPAITPDLLREKCTTYLKQLVGEALKIPIQKIDSGEPFEKYGIDSILVVQLTNNLNRVFENINSTLFFEYQTIDGLVGYFLEKQKDSLIKLAGLGERRLEEGISGATEKFTQSIMPSKPASGKAKRFLPPVLPGFTGADLQVRDIAIIGLAGRYPGADHVNEFWINLKSGRNCITEIPKERWDWRKYFDEEKGKSGAMYTKWGGFIRDIDKFDPMFFQISPKEAEKMDPQERLFLEVAYQTIEDAGYTPANLSDSRKVGVFTGVMNGYYSTRAKYWSIANRISYLFNFQGPSVAVDTACSSSLTAVHFALESLYGGLCECAVAGGVNLIVAPQHYLGLSEMMMLSPGNQCRAFGDQADGFVDGEGVGAVLLKPLAKAVADGDHIYGIIKGSMLNAGGKTNGYTVPNPKAQYQLITGALQRAGVDARTISYVEAHGTGTALGDPIEIAGLTQAFAQDTKDRQFCVIGSAKSNIGHCESAAGIAGLTKVLLQMNNRQIAPSLHSEILNPHIDFTSTPFLVRQELTEWRRPVIEINGAIREYPRRAGISSFGAGGANAHLVIEEYIPREPETPIPVSARNPAMIVLSAQNEDRLKEVARLLLDAIVEQQFTSAGLADLAYTLQVGREAKEERLGVIVGSMEELAEKLRSFGEGENGILDLYRGQVKSNKEILAVFAADEDLGKTVETWIAKGKYGKLLDLWVKGLIIDWNRLYGNIKPRRISLPTYPFAKERYWVPVGANNYSPLQAPIHPLLHQNTSDFAEQRFSSIFTGREFFLADHVVKGRRILPGVVYLEMARAAVIQAAGLNNETGIGISIKNTVWTKPVIVEREPVRVHIGLFPEENGTINFVIYSRPEGEVEPVTHCEGSVALRDGKKVETLNLESLRLECVKGSLSAEECYEAFRTMGIEYGQGQRGIEQIYLGTDQVLAKLSLPSSILETQGQFVLHPSLTDAALQATIGFMTGSGNSNPGLPFALEELDIFGKCPNMVWAVIRRGGKAGDKTAKFDLDLCDDQGTICARLKGFSLRVWEGETGAGELPAAYGSLLLHPCWKEETVVPEERVPRYIQHRIFLCELEGVSQKKIAGQMDGADCRVFKSIRKGPDERFQAYSAQLFEEIQNLLKGKPEGKVLIQVVVSQRGEEQLCAGLLGLLKSAQQENPNLIGQLIEVETGEKGAGIARKLKENSLRPHDCRIRYQDIRRYLAGWNEITVSREPAAIPWKDQGIYLITGGAGGLGLIFAKEIARQVKKPALILTGRSPLSPEKQNGLRELETLGARVEYRQVDVTDRKAISGLIKRIWEDFGSLNGIIHSAGVIQDNYIIKKTKKELVEVLAPKVTGLVNLDQASKDLPLDFLILFSSLAGSLGNPGQADYSAANAFLDAFARYRNELAASNLRRGRTISINWPLWKEGGMRVPEETERMMTESAGMTAIDTLAGIQAFYQSLASGNDQIMVLEGNLSLIKPRFLSTEVIKSGSSIPFATAAGSGGLLDDVKTASQAVPVFTGDLLRENTINYFKMLLSPVIKLPAGQIEADAPLEKYGIDSIMVMQLTNQLEKTFGSLPKTLFFEYQNIQSLAGYFLERYRDRLTATLGYAERVAVTAENLQDSVAATGLVKSALNSRVKSRFAPLRTDYREEKGPLDIAVIGVSGRYPGARNIQEFWNNLRDGKDCITEIPGDRWDYNLYYDEDKQKPGKTNSKWGGFLEGVDQFDPLFFNISPREAEIIDPQERLFLECVYETIEDAGYTRETLGLQQGFGLEGNVGVFVGVMFEEYQLYGAQEQVLGRPVALGGNAASIANRVSYFGNFHGPSMAVNTMCSSSLTAIHLACRHLQLGECGLAIAGGVNVSVHPNKYLALGQGKFASSKGRCESFGQGGDGYVPGEGVGAVLLKPLSQAIADGDRIYGIIKGTALNHDGKTNGFTVPNPNAQSSVIGRALQTGGIDPRTISYLEAHGTGTSLGDPIEIAGLTKTFFEYTNDKQFCAIGSAKSNIGHCESAAGIAGVTKVLLQLKYGQLAPSLHSEVLNPNIDFINTPFIVQQALEEWKRPVVESGGEFREYPRRAGISSFGAGGSNAHVVIEEFLPNGRERFSGAGRSQHPPIIVLSARNEDRLKEQARRLLGAIGDQQFSDADLPEIAYTLQVGREAMEERLAMLAGSIEELRKKLQGFLEDEDGTPDLYRGQTKRTQEALAVLAADEDLQKGIDTWLLKGKYEKLLDLWVKGLTFDWNKLYGEVKPSRIGLPAYPFARERYWVSVVRANNYSPLLPATIHPLLHQNTSDLSEQRFTSTFTGQEFFLTDHVVKGRRILPGVVYLEMARAAVEQAAGLFQEGKSGIRLKNTVWARPVVVEDQPVPVHIGLFPEENGAIAYEIYSRSGGDAEPVVHCQGQAFLDVSGNVAPLNLKLLQDECGQRRLSPGECYEVFRSMGIEYGPGHRGIERIYLGPGLALAKLSLTSSVSDTRGQFVLHPSIMDAALQATIALTMDSGNLKPALPFALQELEIFGGCSSPMWALVRYDGGGKAGDQVEKYDIDLSDDAGKICARMKGFSLRVLEGEAGSPETPANLRTLLFHPDWIEQATAQETAAPAYDRHLVIFCEPDQVSPENIERRINGVRCLILKSQRKGIADRFQTYAGRVFEEILNILKDKSGGQVLIQIVLLNGKEQDLFSGLAGLLKTARLEHSKLIGQLIEMDPGEDPDGIIEKLRENSRNPLDNRIRYQSGKRFVAGWKEIEAVPDGVSIPWKDRGIYLITGGAGGLGMIFAKEIAGKAKDVTLVLTGRSPLGEEQQAKLRELRTLGVTAEYRAVDVTQKKAVADLIRNIGENFGDLNGIIHSAGVIRDNFILNKTREELEEVLAPKVAGAVNLDEASRDLNLDFLVLFSSLAGAIGNIGQADYATANAFLDAFAGYRNNLVALKQRRGLTLSINWPFWKEGGMRVDQATERILQNSGMNAMETSSGIKAFYQSLTAGQAQAVVMEGQPARIRQILLAPVTPASRQSKITPAASAAIPRPETGGLMEKVQTMLVQMVSKILKVKFKEINLHSELNEYGFDSVTLAEFAHQLNQEYRMELAPTIFFNYPTLDSFAEYLVEEYPEAIMEQAATETPVPTVNDEKANPQFSGRRRSRFADSDRLNGPKMKSTTDPVAVIGISGVFPMARDLDQFWKNLMEGKDCITEIPKDRWDWREYSETNFKWGGFIDGVWEFDPLFFGISPREAELMDPQQRLFLENCWHCFEDAGLTPATLSGSRAGVFVGCGDSTYEGFMGGQGYNIEALMGNVSSILAARISYFLNLKGPCFAIDTACSSALVAIVEACNNLSLQTCDLALAGGVSVSAPSIYLMTGDGGMLSPDGRCFTFDNQANGFVPGEGVGVILLKRLSEAVRDRDPIYGIIRGWGINQDGKTNGITAPSMNSQMFLEQEVYQRFGIHPETISLMEAHGTATPLGDPIEVEALTGSFQSFTGKKNYCALGTVKSNIGHLLAAAGAAGVIKVLLALGRRMLPPTLHYETLNKHISLHNSPFYINTRLRSWETIPGIPRRAAVSSFGFSGTNAHLVIEEYLPGTDPGETPDQISPNNPIILVLSAKSQAQLRIYAERIRNFVDSHQDLNLTDLAYTLQAGREAMDYRLAFLADSRKACLETLTEFLNGNPGPGVLTGEVSKNKGGVGDLETDEDARSLLQSWIQKGKRKRIAGMWVNGLNIDWNKLYGASNPRRINLPAYPFARENYWVSAVKQDKADRCAVEVYHHTSLQHPLVHQNTSDFSEQRFSSTFTGRELFLADHPVKGRRVLPAMACLEMARTAVALATGALEEPQAGIRLKNVVWIRPIIMGEESLRVHTGLYPDDTGEITFEIYSDTAATGEDPKVYCRGSAALGPVTQVPALDLQALQAECNQSSLTLGQCSEIFRSLGLADGPKDQAIEMSYLGKDQVLAKLSLPSSTVATGDRLVLHPSLMEAAWQASLSLMKGSGVLKPCFPSTLQELEIFGKYHSSMWARIRCGGELLTTDQMRLEIDLCDAEGTVLVRMKGLELSPNGESQISEDLETSSANAAVSPTQEPYELLTFEEVWQEQALPDHASARIKTLVCFVSKIENRKAIREAVQDLDPQTKLIFISQNKSPEKSSQPLYQITRGKRSSYEEVLREIGKEYGEIGAIFYCWPLEDRSCLEDYGVIVDLIQAISAVKFKTKWIFLTAPFVDELERCYPDSWIGFERSLGMIMPNTQLAVMMQEDGKPVQDWFSRLWAELAAPKTRSVWYQDGNRRICRVRPITIPPEKNVPIRLGGTYLITGGCGGLGFLFARYLATKAAINLILTGRSPLDGEKQTKIKELEELGGQVRYLRADLSDQAAMSKELAKAKEILGPIRGVIHSAGNNDHLSIIHKDFPSFQKVLDPKVQGTLILEELLAGEPLDFICYFSSLTPILGDFGGCDYAVANRFLMAFAHYRNLRQLPGKTLVINWPIWRDGGMTVGKDENIELLLHSSGQRYLETGEGLALFDRLLAQSKTQVIIVAGQPSPVRRFLGLVPEQAVAESPIVFTPSDHGRRPEMKGFSLEQCLEWDLKAQIGKLLKIPQEKLDRGENLAGFGFNSISLTRFAGVLSNYYGIEITPALFYGYPTLQKLTQYFLQEYQETIREFYREDQAPQVDAKRVSRVEVRQPRPASGKTRFITRNVLPGVREPIAIIGMSGRFPQSRNIDEMWRIIAEGRDAVGEIPADRFDWREYYGNPRHESRKISSKWLGSIPGVREFDPLFFEISPKEAETMDPRQRLLLQEAWWALEDAGYGVKQIKTNKIGMFVGAEMGDYQLLTAEWGNITSNLNSILAARLAYFLNLNGPVLAIDTACSSGLAAAHQACLSLRSYECDAAIAAGVNLFLTPEAYIMMSQAGMLSEDGKCYTFDKKANGMVPGEAVAVVVLKRLSQAERDGDPIYAVIRGSGINYDGKTNGITAPSGVAQTSLLKTVYNQFQVNPEEIEYIVAHGTGTKLGDPIEVNALYDTFKNYTQKQNFCALTSTKTNFGHTFSPSGIISLISLVQAFRHEVIPASLHCEEENDFILWKESPFYVNKTNKPWPKKGGIRRTGAVSAFGMSGTNVHLVVQSYEAKEAGVFPTDLPYYLLALSAKTQESLAEKITDLIAVLQNKDFNARDLLDISFTLLEGRQHFNHRLAVVIRDREDAIHVLNQAAGKEKLPNLFQGKVPREFTGQKTLEEFLQDLFKQCWSPKDHPVKYQKIVLTLADLYCQGYEIDGEQLYGGFKPRRIHLPGYPFTREEYWIPETNSKKNQAGGNSPVSTSLHFEEMGSPQEHNQNEDFQEKPVPEAEVVLTGKELNEVYTELEKSVAEVWGKELGLREINVYDHFLEIGGNSIIAVKLEVEMGKRGLVIESSEIDQYPSVAAIASFISQKTGQDRGGKKTLDNIKPFNDIFYRNCFYNDLFPTLRYFQKEIIPFLVNDVAVYTRPEGQEANLPTVCYKSVKTLEQLLHDQGLAVSSKSSCDRIINDLISGISQNRPVIIWIDGYYAPFREDLYQKEHWAHSWLVYGYDDAQQVFDIVEHRHRGSLTYKKYQVSYRDLENSFMGCLRNLDQENNRLAYYEFYLDNNGNSPGANLTDQCRKIMAANLVNHKEAILEGLKEVQVLAGGFREIISSKESLDGNINALVEMFNDIINARKAELYKIGLLFREKDDLIGLLDKVIKGWDFIRLKLARCMYASEFDRKSLDAVMGRLENMYQDEMEYHRILIAFLEEII